MVFESVYVRWGGEDWGKYNADLFMFCYCFFFMIYYCFFFRFYDVFSHGVWVCVCEVGRIGGSITLMSRCSFKFATNCNQGRPSTQNLKRAKNMPQKAAKNTHFPIPDVAWSAKITTHTNRALSQNNTTLQNCKLFVFNWPKVARKIQQECDIDVKLVEIWGNCAVWWSVALSTYDLPSVAVPYSSQSCRHLLHIFTIKFSPGGWSRVASFLLSLCPLPCQVRGARYIEEIHSHSI